MRDLRRPFSRSLAIILALVALLAVSVGDSAASPREDPDQNGPKHERFSVCHATGSGFVLIEVSESGWLNGHSKHGDELASETNNCAGTPSASTSDTSRLTSVAISASKASPQNVGTSVTFTATPTPSISTQYKWWKLAPGSTTWEVLEDWGDNTYTWNTGGLGAGTYLINVWARTAGSTADTYQVYDEISYVLNPAATVTPTVTPTAGTTGTSETGNNPGRGNGRGHNGR